MASTSISCINHATSIKKKRKILTKQSAQNLVNRPNSCQLMIGKSSSIMAKQYANWVRWKGRGTRKTSEIPYRVKKTLQFLNLFSIVQVMKAQIWFPVREHIAQAYIIFHKFFILCTEHAVIKHKEKMSCSNKTLRCFHCIGEKTTSNICFNHYQIPFLQPLTDSAEDNWAHVFLMFIIDQPIFIHRFREI